MSSEPAQFVFMTCRAGAESALKGDLARTDPAWRPAFSRPGFLTFKVPAEQKVDESRLATRQFTFAHAHGISLGRFTGARLSDLVDQVWHDADLLSLLTKEPIRDIHVWQREVQAPNDQGFESMITPLAEEIELAMCTAAPESCEKLKHATQPRADDSKRRSRRRASGRNALVLDVVIVEPGEWCVGYHRVKTTTQRWPGGAIPVRMPPHAVSRAYLKMEEAIQWSALPVAPDDEVVEIGCAPGGASQALLDRGLFVTGIDPADVDPAVLAHPRFRHLKKRGKEVRRKEFLDVRWLASDMNIAPQVTLDTVEAIISHSNVSIRGLILTLKFADWSDADQLHGWIERIRAWGYRDVRVRQLVTGGMEVCVAALKRKALRRLGRAQTGKRQSTSNTRTDGPHTAPPEPHIS